MFPNPPVPPMLLRRCKLFWQSLLNFQTDAPASGYIPVPELRSPFPVPSVSHNITADVQSNIRRPETTPVIFSFSFHLPDRVPIPDAKPLFHIFHSCKGAIRYSL